MDSHRLDLGSLTSIVENRLVDALPRQRWFRSKARAVRRVRLADACSLPMGVLAIVDVMFDRGPSERYCLPLASAATRGCRSRVERRVM